MLDRGGGVIQAIVYNDLPYAIKASFTWSWDGATGISVYVLLAAATRILQVTLPDGYDAPLEILASTITQ
jgi:hypothetical protein